MKELKGLQDSVKEIEKLFTDYEDMLLLIEMSEGEDEEQEAAEEIEEELGIFEEVFEKLRISTLLIGPYDADNAIVTLHAGAGGTEAMDWTSMLYRMYSRWAEKRGYEVEVLDYLEGDVAGIKGVTLRSREKMLMVISVPRKVYIVWYVFLHLMQMESDRRHLHPAM